MPHCRGEPYTDGSMDPNANSKKDNERMLEVFDIDSILCILRVRRRNCVPSVELRRPLYLTRIYSKKCLLDAFGVFALHVRILRHLNW